MTKTFLNRHRGPSIVASLVAGLVGVAGCVDDAPESSSIDQALTGADLGPPVIPAMTYLAALPAEDGGETALARIFAQATVDHVPVGDGTGYPVLFNSAPQLNWLASQLWGGKTLRVVSADTHPNGDPIVRLDNKIIKTPAGALLDLFDAYVVRSRVSDLAVGINSRGETVPPPAGVLDPVGVSFLAESVEIDDQPSILLNYFADRSLPIIRRVLDEIREVDAVSCPGLYLGRAHVRRCTSLACGETPTALVDFPERFTLGTRYQWAFWTYFLLNFGQDGASCDLGPVIERVEAELGTDLPAVPSAT